MEKQADAKIFTAVRELVESLQQASRDLGLAEWPEGYAEYMIRDEFNRRKQRLTK